MINQVFQLVRPHVFSVKYDQISPETDVLVRPRFMSLCHADQRYYQGTRSEQTLEEKLPMALIHECWGEVVNDISNEYKPGDKVVLIPNVATKQSEIILENYRTGSYFLSSGHDGFLRELVNIPKEQIVAFGDINNEIASITELISVNVHAVKRFIKTSHENRQSIGLIGDGSVSYILACVLKRMLPDSKITVIGRNENKMSMFSFVDQTYHVDKLPADLEFDHAFECAGGEGSVKAIDDIIKYIRPQGTVCLLGVSENKVPINTRDILEKGLTLIGCSRSGREDFIDAVKLMENKTLQKRLNSIVYSFGKVKSISDLHKAFEADLRSPFKTVFEWDC